MNETVEEFMQRVALRSPGEAEFHQAVEEVASSVWPVLDRHPEYVDARILDRMVEPERVIMFRVPWQDDSGQIHVNRGFRVEMNSAIESRRRKVLLPRSTNQVEARPPHLRPMASMLLGSAPKARCLIWSMPCEVAS